ncbi:MAG: protein kinase [Alphaproteobacteria bacterium]|nr:protein kinase [Alphaproteobacteria bacterium]
MSSPIPLGPFDLLRRIGGGGMGEVWEGAHRTQRLPVAVKILPHVGRGLAALRSEVRAMARLDHPAIAAVHDMGVLPEATASASGGRLTAGSPFLVMELCHGGDLVRWCGRLRWSDARAVLLSLLDALAHAHARGVIHRDIKPANVLLGSWQDLRPGPKLVDFGVAWSLRESGALRLAGTPAYMAPEQLQAAAPGPWTDLYALGRLALAVVAGSPSAVTHPPEAAPEGFLPWVSRLLQVDPRDRYACAADAAEALRALGGAADATAIREDLEHLGDPDGARQASLTVDGLLDGVTMPLGLADPTGDDLLSAPTVNVTLAAPTTDGLLDGSTTPLDGHAVTAPAAPDVPPAPLRRATPPDTWRRAGPERRHPPLLGTGLSLHGLRAVPLVGREPQQDRLWAALLEVIAARRPRVVVLHGPSGSGRGHLARWLGERAQELGAARVLALQGGPRPLAAGLRRLLRCEQLPLTACVRRLADALGDDGPIALAEALALVSDDPAEACVQAGLPPVRFKTSAERIEAAISLIGQLSATRALVVLVPRAPESPLGLRLLARLCATEGPVLAVATARDEAMAVPDEGFAALLDRDAVERLAVGPLDPEAHHRLIQEILGFSGALGEQVARRTAGNPQLALLTLDHLVSQGLLEPGPHGFRLREGAALRMPEDLQSAWDERVERLLGGWPEARALALERAAVLGQAVEPLDWADACAADGLDAGTRAAALDALLSAGLARRGGDAGTWSFGTPMLREALLRHGSRAGRLADHHRACADMLEAREDRDPPQQERLAEHLIACGAGRRALPPLLEAIAAARKRGELAHTEGLLDRFEARCVGLPEDDPMPAEATLERWRLALNRGGITELRPRITALLAQARRHGWATIEAHAALCEVIGLRQAGRLEESVAVGREGLAVAERLGLSNLAGKLHYTNMLSLLRLGRRDEAMTHLEAVDRHMRAEGDDLMRASAELYRGRLLQWRGEYAPARVHLEEALRIWRAHGERLFCAMGCNTLGDIARFQGRLDEAEALYTEARALFARMGPRKMDTVVFNLGLLRLEQGAYVEGRALLEREVARYKATGTPIQGAVAGLCLLPVWAAEGDWDRLVQELDEAEAVLQHIGHEQHDGPRSAEHAARLARAAGQHTLARRLLVFAAAQWRRMDVAGEADRVEALIG